MGTAWPATRPTHSFLKLCAYPLNVLPSGFRPLDGDNPADPLTPRKWRNILPFCSRRRVRNENSSQIRWYSVYSARRDRSLNHGFESKSTWLKKAETARRVAHLFALFWRKVGFRLANLTCHARMTFRNCEVSIGGLRVAVVLLGL